MRKFYLLNDKGEKFAFDYSSKVLVSSIQGLGFTKTNTYFNYDNIYKKDTDPRHRLQSCIFGKISRF